MSVRLAIASTSRAAVSTLSRPLLPCTCAHLRTARSPSVTPSTSIAFPSIRTLAGGRGRPGGGGGGSSRPAQQMGRDDAIRFKWIKLVLDESEGGGLSPLEQKNKVLRRIERREFILQQVDTMDMTAEELEFINETRGKVAICKLIDRREARQAMQERELAAKERRRSQAEEKELQLTWGVSVNDLGHKLKKAKQVIDKGGKVALVISAPKGSKLPLRQERQAFVAMLKQQLGLGTDACKVWKEDEWRGSKTTAFLAGTAKATSTSQDASPPAAARAEQAAPAS